MNGAEESDRSVVPIKQPNLIHMVPRMLRKRTVAALCTLNGDFFHPAVLEYCRERDVLVMNDIDLLNILRSLS